MNGVIKLCFKCRENKPLSEFYKHPMMGDGHLGKCITCTKRDTAERVQRLQADPTWIAKEHKIKADRLADWAQRKGLIRKATACERCGASPKRLEKHHPDYTQPLLVQWLCPSCHGLTRRKP